MNNIVTFIIKDIMGSTYGAIAFDEGKCVWSSAMVSTKAEAQAMLDAWEAEHNEGAKA